MKFTLAQIGENRLKKVLVEDKGISPERVCEILKNEFLKITKDYLENPQIEIYAEGIDENIVFDVQIKCSRVKVFGVLA